MVLKGLKTQSAIRIVATTFGALVGLAGIEHGILEILQGNTKPEGLIIDAIGPSQRIWKYSSETALTVIPNMLWSGIFSVILGMVVSIWAIRYVDKKYGARILMLLSILLWLVGGGFAPLLMAVFAFVAASLINKPLIWWREHLPNFMKISLGAMWPWSILIYVFAFVIGVEIAIFGYPLLWIFNFEVTYSIQWALALIMMMLWPISVLTAIAYDIR